MSVSLRQRYLEFFRSQRHAIVPSAPLRPENDPTTLFTGSGMQPMLPYLLGEPHPLGRRIADSQKCFRSQDIEEVGDNRHTTFFEMLGNWSLGDYFKEEQIRFMFAFLTEEIGLDPRRLYFTCFRGNDALGIPKDTESAELWQTLFQDRGLEAVIADFPERDGMQGGRIFYYDEKKNWWSRAGIPSHMPVGEPGGPDTEMFWDFDPENQFSLHAQSLWKDEPCHVNCDCGRFMEIGNNVFMEYQKTDTGFVKLAQQNVDFGGGLERIAAASLDNPDVFRIDLFDRARQAVEAVSGKAYGENPDDTYAYRVILDHIRAAVFLIGDGIVPSNKDQGYFVRRLIRRAVRFAGHLGIRNDFIAEVGQAFIDTYADDYVSLVEKQSFIRDELAKEEVKFRKTLETGLKEFKKLSGEAISGVDAFMLFSSYGFPVELTEELAREARKSIDLEGFRQELEKHQDLSRTASAGKFKGGLADHSDKVTAFHTATHLLLAGLRQELGGDIHQAGSNITDERTRFDFTYPEKVSREVLDRVEMYVNAAINAPASVTTVIMDKEEARAAGVEGSFWEKYPDKVTVYQVEGADGTTYSRELCGGPHVKTTTEIAAFGRFKIQKEEACSAGIRRIKAILA
ncbi:MAG: alanine--tRNA ligase [Candidatus Moranbacteria bacterium]|nr:alanine--tRNA ligase [Candidatus Moranbacteria bacterium]MBP6034167.1 alanine--tRNA ligase [Candidatus Moranbacteria bacterium]MBP7695732.1 alanine--tRNA ligase [Candidatus Moranbacteria bacterium]